MKIGRKVIQLNSDYQILTVISLKKAVSKLISNKAVVILEDKDKPFLHPSLNIKPPLIIALKKYVYVPYVMFKITKKNILLRDRSTCQYCGVKLGKRSYTTIDHVIPKSHKDFPGNTWENLVACCSKCNNRKGNKTPSEANMKLLKEPIRPTVEDLVISDRILKNKYQSLIKERLGILN